MTDPLSPRARAKLAHLEAKAAAGTPIGWADLFGIAEPNPDLADCPSSEDGYRCELPNHHDGPHTATLRW